MTKSLLSTFFKPDRLTSTNMNANEVIANRALELIGKDRGGKEFIPTIM